MYTDTDPQNVLNYGKFQKKNNEKSFFNINSHAYYVNKI